MDPTAILSATATLSLSLSLDFASTRQIVLALGGLDAWAYDVCALEYYAMGNSVCHFNIVEIFLVRLYY